MLNINQTVPTTAIITIRDASVFLERWPSGLRRRSRKAESPYGGPWVRITPSPRRDAGVAEQARLESV